MNMIEVDHVSVTYILGDIKELSLKEFFIRKMHGEVITKSLKHWMILPFMWRKESF